MEDPRCAQEKAVRAASRVMKCRKDDPEDFGGLEMCIREYFQGSEKGSEGLRGGAYIFL